MTGGRARDPRWASAAAAVLVRAVVAVQAFSAGVATPKLDAVRYLDWAGDIAGGDVLGRGGVVHGEPFLFNPLYAYVLAPLVGVFGRSPAAVVVFQTLLAGATAALAAAAARRLSGTVAAWTAGLAVAFSAPLVHLDGKVAVSGLAAFLVAGAVWSTVPGEKPSLETSSDASRPGAQVTVFHLAPYGTGLWLGASVLARPVALFAVPFAAWLFARRGGARAAALVVVPVALCAGLSFARNVAVSGEPVVFTAADGLNLHLGNGPAARRDGVMASDHFRFSPAAMHEDAKVRVAYELRREPTRSEVSSWFADLARRDFAAAPAESLAWCATKLRWALGPAEFGSSEDFDVDRPKVPLLLLAFVPTWLLIALAAAAPIVARRRPELLLGAGALVAAHVVACVVVYPLSHYRSPAVPALAVMAGATVAGCVDQWRTHRRRVAAAAATAVALAVLAALPPQPGVDARQSALRDAGAAMDRGDLAAADEIARAALVRIPDQSHLLAVRYACALAQKRFEDARAFASKLVSLRPWDAAERINVAWCDARLGRESDARREADEVAALHPWNGDVRCGRAMVVLGLAAPTPADVERAREDLEFAISRGVEPPAWALAKAGLTPSRSPARDSSR
jgi:hypothetical protein